MSSEIDNLVKTISKLKALGPKSSRRIVLQLIENKEELIRPLTKQLVEIYKNLRRCETCGDYFSVNSKCDCSNKKYKKIFVCEEIQDKWTVEESGIYSGGGYHVIGGVLPAFERKKNGKLLISSLVNRVKDIPMPAVHAVKEFAAYSIGQPTAVVEQYARNLHATINSSEAMRMK